MIPSLQVLAVPPKLPPNVHMVRNKIGKPYCYLQRHRGSKKPEPRVRLPDIADPAFWAEYARLVNLPVVQPRTDSVARLIEAWQASPQWSEMSKRTRQEWARLCRIILDAWADVSVSAIEPKHVLVLQDSLAARPATANNLIRCLSSAMGWSVPRGWRLDNPCREVKLLKTGDGYAPWPWEVIEASKADLPPYLWNAVALALYTGQRISDVLRMRWSAINVSGLMAVKQGKTGKELMIPLHRDLKAVLDNVERRAVTILTTLNGTPWTENGFQATWRKHKPVIVREHGLVFHGLRKSAVVTLLECGCTDAEVAAITGQSRQMVEHYARKVNQEHLARSAILRWETGRT